MSSLRERIETGLRDRIQAAEQAAGAQDKKLDLGPLMARLDDIIEIIEGVRDYSVEPYRQRVREIICPTCRQDEDGNCKARADEVCGLDKYLDTIIAVVEQELKQNLNTLGQG